jgi:homoserine kinase type II
LTWIHDVLRHVYLQGFKAIPLPRNTTAGVSFVAWHDRLWELTAWLPGMADFERAPDRTKLAAAMTALAEFHTAASTFPACAVQVGPPAGLASRCELLQRLDREQFARLCQTVRHKTSPWNAVASQILSAYDQWHDQVARLLSEALQRPVRNHVCLRDIWHDHVLFVDGQVSGLIDFGAMNIDCVAADISRLLGSLVADNPQMWSAGMTAYEAKRRLTKNERLAMKAYDVSSVVLSGMNWLNWLLLEGRQFEATEQVRRRLDAILRRLVCLQRSRAL